MKTHNARIKAERMAARRERKKKAAAQKSRKPDGVTEQRCGRVARPAEPAVGPPSVWELGSPAACAGRPDLLADGFEFGDFRRWAW